jgi:tRNA pseudouridine55 synthase
MSGPTGILLMDKPAGMTSHDVVDHVRRAAGTRRVGHTGTLDPGATGLLVLCLGSATRLSEHLTGLDKTYEGSMRLGVETDSYDMDGKVLSEKPVPELTLEQIQKACNAFTGDILQAPPMVSAVKVGGERLYKKARQGEVVERVARPVTVREFVALSYDPPDVTIRVRCTRGTYVRSLCHDVGQSFGCGAIMASLRRTYVGRFGVENALTLDNCRTPEDVKSHLMPIDNALDLPVIVVRATSRPLVLAGTAIGADDFTSTEPVKEDWVQIKTETGKLLALGQVHQGPFGAYVHPKRVLVD